MKRGKIMVSKNYEKAGKCRNCNHDLVLLWKSYGHSIYLSGINKYGHRKGYTKKTMKHCFCGCIKPELKKECEQK